MNEETSIPSGDLSAGEDTTSPVDITSLITEKKKKHPNSLKNLKPYPKGVSGNTRGNKGAVHLKPILNKKLNKLKAEAIVDSIIDGAVAGSDRKQDRLLKLTGDLVDQPQVNIQNNTIIDANILDLARQYLQKLDNNEV